MKIHSKLYIGGEWVDPLNPSIFEVVNPLTETVCATVAGGGEDDVARAVAAAREAFKEFVRRQNIWRNSRCKLAECGPRLGVDVRRRACGAASADVRWSVA